MIDVALTDFEIRAFQKTHDFDALTARLPLSPPAMIEAYSRNRTFIMEQAGEVGTIETGKGPDLAVFEENLPRFPAAAIGDAKESNILIQGEVVYQK